jgi:CheY-like chemotaxis protein
MGRNILYVEDNPDNMMLVQRALEARGYCLLKAVNGLSGVEVDPPGYQSARHRWL